MGGPTRSSGMGACTYQTSVATTQIVQSNLHTSMSPSSRPAQVVSNALESRDSLSLGINPSPLDSLGMDQLRLPGGDNVGSSAASTLSPTSLVFPLRDSSFSSLSAVSVSSAPRTASAVSFVFSSAPPLSFSSSFSLPSFAPSSLSSASFPSASSVSSALPHSISSVLAASSLAPLPLLSLPLSSSAPPTLPPPPGFLPSTFSSSSSAPSFPYPPLSPSSSSCFFSLFFFLMFRIPLRLPPLSLVLRIWQVTVRVFWVCLRITSR